VWGIVPLYFGWIVNELTASKATFSTSIQTGFALLWAGTQWVWQAVHSGTHRPEQTSFLPVNLGVTAVVLILGALALGSGLRRRYPRGMRFLGHSRFAGYFMIALFPVQSGYLTWTWQRLAAIAVFAIPVWLLLHFSVMPLRKK